MKGLSPDVPPLPPLVAGQQPDREVTRVAPERGAMDDEFFLEIRKLKLRQQEVRQLETVLQERIHLFREHLQRLMENQK